MPVVVAAFFAPVAEAGRSDSVSKPEYTLATLDTGAAADTAEAAERRPPRFAQRDLAGD